MVNYNKLPNFSNQILKNLLTPLYSTTINSSKNDNLLNEKLIKSISNNPCEINVPNKIIMPLKQSKTKVNGTLKIKEKEAFQYASLKF